MKNLNSLRMALLLLAGSAVLLLTPSCKAQSEVSPDHFDGTDSWAAAAQTPRPLSHKLNGTSKTKLQSSKNAATSTFQLAAAREASKPVRKDAVAVDRKRKTIVTNPQQK